MSYYNEEDLARFGEIGKMRPELFEKFMAWYQACQEEGALVKTRKSFDRFGRRGHGAMPVLHRRLHEFVSGKRLEYGADDRSDASCFGNSRRREPDSRHPIA